MSLAFSLGDIDLKSHLGETLNARISINDTEANIDSSCFSVSDISEVPAFKKVTTALTGNSNNLALSISSSQVISEPIINLSVTYHCEPRVNREYVLLLDPAPAAEPNPAKVLQPTNSEKLATASQTVSGKPAKSNPVTDGLGNDTDDIPAPPVKKKRAKKKSTPKAVSTDAQLTEAYTGKPNNAPSENIAANSPSGAAQPTPVKSEQPYLVISGGNTSAGDTATPNLALRMERQIDLNRNQVNEAPLSTTEAMDEVTVMANRLAHLEKQILSLQSQNQQLQAQAEKAQHAEFQLPPAIWDGLRYLGIAALVAFALAALVAGRRRWSRHRHEEAEWYDSDAFADEAESGTDLAKQMAKFTADPLFAEAAAQSTIVNAVENDEAESVLEHAEVFIAHGRPILAIQLLQNHLVDAPTQSPTIWLKLLSLLANEDSETEYDVAVIECNQFFNIKLPSFAEANTPDHSSIEDHPHIVDRLEGAWGSASAITLLNDLIYNQHAQPREGFARGTFEELYFLKKIAEALQSSDTLAQSPNLKPKSVDATVAITGTAAMEAAHLQQGAQVPTQNAGANQNPESAHMPVGNEGTRAGLENASLASTLPPIQASNSIETDTGINMDWQADLEETVLNQADTAEIAASEFPLQDYAAQAFSIAPETSSEAMPDQPDSTFHTNFEVSEIDYPASEPEIEPPAMETIELVPLSPSFEPAENISFETEFADALEFDQDDLSSPAAPKLEITPDEKSNTIEFDWDLPKINKD